jgi:glutamine---fructose-6-phosphate transaminase (isomerizing)
MLADEARDAAAGARRQIARCMDVLAELVHRLAAHPPTMIVTCARGSSDHAATYGKYVLETTTGRIVASIGPSIASLYDHVPQLAGALVLAVSQSGRSPDVLALAEVARRSGALVVGLVNDEASPLAAACELVLPLCAGEEHAVAATKSCLLAGVAFVQLAAAWTGDATLHDAIARIPDALEAACELDWDLASLATARDLYVVARGVGLGAALELALKLKETCRIHAEAFSTAEILHGPIALVEPDFPIIALAQDDATGANTRDVIARLAALGARVYSTADVAGTVKLPTVEHVPAIVAPLCYLQTAYLALPALARARGLDADAPAHLAKITRTL